MLVAMDRHSGEILWTRRAEYGFRHNALVAAAGKVFCIDTLPEGDEDTTNFTVTLKRDGDLNQVTTFTLSIEGSGATDTAEGNDFGQRVTIDDLPFKEVGTFAFGEDTTVVDFLVRGDLDFEPDDSFIVRVEDLENGTIA